MLIFAWIFNPIASIYLDEVKAELSVCLLYLLVIGSLNFLLLGDGCSLLLLVLLGGSL